MAGFLRSSDGALRLAILDVETDILRERGAWERLSDSDRAMYLGYLEIRRERETRGR